MRECVYWPMLGASVVRDIRPFAASLAESVSGPKALTLCSCFAGDSRGFALPLCVSNGYTIRMMKDSGLRIRVERTLRDRFLEACRAHDKPAAQVIREFMRAYVDRHERAPGSPATEQQYRQDPTHEY